MYSVRRTLDSYGDKVDDDLRSRIEQSVEKMKEALTGVDYVHIKDMFEELKEASYKFAEVIYSKQDKGTEAQGGKE